jgi:hypothetical protein
VTEANAEAGAPRQEEVSGANHIRLEADHAELVPVEYSRVYAARRHFNPR